MAEVVAAWHAFLLAEIEFLKTEGVTVTHCSVSQRATVQDHRRLTTTCATPNKYTIGINIHRGISIRTWKPNISISYEHENPVFLPSGLVSAPNSEAIPPVFDDYLLLGRAEDGIMLSSSQEVTTRREPKSWCITRIILWKGIFCQSSML